MKSEQHEFGIAIKEALLRYRRAVMVSTDKGRLESLDRLIEELGQLHLKPCLKLVRTEADLHAFGAKVSWANAFIHDELADLPPAVRRQLFLLLDDNYFSRSTTTTL